jgi:hypothetical protein
MRARGKGDGFAFQARVAGSIPAARLSKRRSVKLFRLSYSRRLLFGCHAAVASFKRY